MLIFKGLKSCGVLVNSAGWRLPCRSGPPVDGPKDPWPRVLSLPGRFVGDPASLARDNIYLLTYTIKLSLPLVPNVVTFIINIFKALTKDKS